jgi:hypothetical protein
VPAFSLAEPHQAIAAKAKARSRPGEDLRRNLGELGRSKPHREIPAKFDVLAAVLLESAQLERYGLRQAVSEFLSKAETIALDVLVLRSAADSEARV